MSEDKQNARQALLSELESIKSLLSEEEWDHIPLLNDPITPPTLTDELSALALTQEGDEQEALDLQQADELEDPVASQTPDKPQTADVTQALNEPEITVDASAAVEPQPLLTPAPPASPSHHQLRASKRPVVEPRGENPFLPPHIRERLHTHKTLVDIIKESPPQPLRPNRETTVEPVAANAQDKSAHEKLPPVLAPEKIHHLVDGIIAIYLPKIEAELRTQLLQALQDNQPAED
jgi:hypothetical protein